LHEAQVNIVPDALHSQKMNQHSVKHNHKKFQSVKIPTVVLTFLENNYIL